MSFRPSILLPVLVCPACRGALALTAVAGGEPDAVTAGTLTCGGCQAGYPIERGVPRLVAGEPDPVKAATVQSFGYQWQAFAREIDAWRARCAAYFEPHVPAELGRGTVLDAGCGYGRWLAFVAEGGGLCVGMDLSDAVFAAAEYLADRPNCHLVQADILNPPFKAGAFDTVYSIGVLHHLPRGAPEGVAALSPLTRAGGLLFVWLYGASRGDQQLTPQTLVRKLTRRLPKPLMRGAVFCGAMGVTAAFIWPKRILGRVADRLPFHTYKALPFSELRTDLFDIYATTIEYGYDGGQVREMLEAAGLSDVQVTPYGIPRDPEQSWRGWGKRP